MSDIDCIKEKGWSEYYNVVKDRPARDTLLKALAGFDSEGRNCRELSAIDLGCGSGTDTSEILKYGFNVFATDKEPEAIKIIEKRFSESVKNGTLKSKAVSFENIVLNEADLINASYSLPFCMPDHFDNLWMKIINSLNIKGRFAGNFFGENDSWFVNKDMTFHSKQKVQTMFEMFEIEYFEEKDEDGETATGNKKHWHVFSVVAKKVKN